MIWKLACQSRTLLLHGVSYLMEGDEGFYAVLCQLSFLCTRHGQCEERFVRTC